jgi:hypothetical protein
VTDGDLVWNLVRIAAGVRRTGVASRIRLTLSESVEGPDDSFRTMVSRRQDFDVVEEYHLLEGGVNP